MLKLRLGHIGQPRLVLLFGNPADQDRLATYSDKESEPKDPFGRCCICGEGLYQHHPFYLVDKTNEGFNSLQTLSFNAQDTGFRIWDNAKNIGGGSNTKECIISLKTFESYYFSELLPFTRRHHRQDFSQHRRGRISRNFTFSIISPRMLAAMSVFAGLSVSASFTLLNQRLHLNILSPAMAFVRFPRPFRKCTKAHSSRFSAF